jgi:hypothetical protein
VHTRTDAGGGALQQRELVEILQHIAHTHTHTPMKPNKRKSAKRERRPLEKIDEPRLVSGHTRVIQYNPQQCCGGATVQPSEQSEQGLKQMRPGLMVNRQVSKGAL